MALKIVGRRPRATYAERNVASADAKHATMQCDRCKKRCFVTFPLGGSREARQAVMREALNEHRRVCTAGPAELERKYEILFSR
jgi:hypothetical protein